MKTIKKIIILAFFVLTFTSGCTHLFQDEESKQSYTENVLCKPTEEKMLEIYSKNKNIKLDKLPECEEFRINSGGYEGLWTSYFVKPLAWIILKVGILVKNYGISIMLLGILLRLLVLPLSKQTIDMSEKMKKANPELQNLEKKYENRQDQDSMMKKNQEMLLIYKKYNIKPFSGCLVSLIQLPLFFAFLEAIQRIPAILEEKLLWFDLGTTPWIELQAGNYYYIIIIILIGVTTYFSFNNMNTASVNKEQEKQTKMMSKMMIVFITIMSFRLNVGIGLYWIATSAFAVVQNIVLKKIREK